jgi:DNA mismatch endonuclease (patch repair protein)
MARVKGQNTKPEIRVRKAMHAAGLRFRLHVAELPGKPDIVLPGRRVAVFVNGCMWHRDPDPACKLARLPKSRLDFWIPKLERNVERDARNQELLRAAGWKPIVIWECETLDPGRLASAIEAVRGTPRLRRGSREIIDCPL